MSGVDSNPEHLYPPFAAAVKKILAEATAETSGKHGAVRWLMFEGYRSQARQNGLYAQGRTKPGPIVTHRQVSNHSTGLAVDCYPVDASGDVMWDAHEELWQQYGHCVRANGMQWGGDYPKITGGTFVDNPHCEPPHNLYLDWGPLAHDYLKNLGLIS